MGLKFLVGLWAGEARGGAGRGAGGAGRGAGPGSGRGGAGPGSGRGRARGGAGARAGLEWLTLPNDGRILLIVTLKKM
jgi:hypothetical protein